MKTNPFLNSRISTLIHYSTLFWTVFCFVGTWFVILKYGILFKGLIATVMLLFFAGVVWTIPFSGLILLSLYFAPPEEARPLVRFQDMIRRALKQGSAAPGREDGVQRGAT